MHLHVWYLSPVSFRSYQHEPEPTCSVSTWAEKLLTSAMFYSFPPSSPQPLHFGNADVFGAKQRRAGRLAICRLPAVSPVATSLLNYTEPNAEIRAARPDVMFVSHTEASGRCFLKKTKERNKRRQMKTARSLDLGLVVIWWPANHLILLDRVECFTCLWVILPGKLNRTRLAVLLCAQPVLCICCVCACVFSPSIKAICPMLGLGNEQMLPL